ncbi:TPA: hypothetical protein HA372_03540 [Candidatus Woesearchaeota archaeon]|nr:hypothetical protein [Candidatus Woesearchaeota archaeon]
MYWSSLLFFIAACYGLGYLATFFVRDAEDSLERHLMRFGTGLGVFVVLGYLLNLLNVPLDYRIFLAIIALGILAVLGHRYWKHRKWGLRKPAFRANPYALAMLILFVITFFMYHKGAFSYPYLEDDDPWVHANGAQYVSLEKTVFAAPDAGLHYLDPYPPAYDMVMGILHQTNDSLFWTLKFFNVLIISLSIIFFFFFAHAFFRSSRKAFYATLVLFAVPAFMSHFIWAIALTMPLIFASFYAIERIRQDGKWMVPASLLIGATLMVSPTHSAYFGLLLSLYVGARTLVERKMIWPVYGAGAIGFGISMALWWIPALVRYGFQGVRDGLGVGANPTLFGIGGTADRKYALADFAIAQKQNMINNPVGLGLVVFLLLLFAVFFAVFKYRKEIARCWKAILPAFLILLMVMLLFLSRFYIKNVPKRNQPAAEVGSVPFLEFLGDEFFVVAVLAILLFTLVMLAVISWKVQDFPDGNLVLVFAWLLFAFYAVNAGPFYIKLSPFRAWMVLAIPAALLAAEGMGWLLAIVRGTVSSFSPPLARPAFIMALVLLLIGIFSTSFVQKYAVNTAQWSPGGFWTSGEEIAGYLWMQQNLPPDAPVYTFSNIALINAFDKYMCYWCVEQRNFQKTGFNGTAQEIHDRLTAWEYGYLVIDGQAVQRFGANATNAKVQELVLSGQFTPQFQNQGIVILSVA